ncbi:hypothetical protein CHS0354_020298 [Potamilus streckersoni]|uniref:Cadherin domain-containing protein n=1 Tax=Potamilus streckersoni TaxID=2493646 RepID=A0AAE0S6D9_9BIVA|nr:hypothetical protein CHS0354_020298 [Potamilus streckersoni]
MIAIDVTIGFCRTVTHKKLTQTAIWTASDNAANEPESGLSGNPYKTTPQIYAYDGDRGINETIKYSIEDSMKSNFGINSTSGEIRIYHELDADGGIDIYVIIIKASQEDNPLRTATSTLSLSVIDIDDNTPIFSPNHYNCSINEHSAVGQVICTVKATDKDKGENANFTYHFRNTSTVIDIDQRSGVIMVKDSQMLDREKETIINVQVVTKYVNDSDGPSTANVTINLIDINDNSPEFNSSSFEFLAWNKSIGDYIGKIDAFDLDEGDNKKLNYSIGMCLSNTGSCSVGSSKCRFPFRIDPQFGNITLNDSSASCVYSALVSVCDSPHYSTRCSTTRLIIHVVSNMTNIVTQTSAVPENAANNSLVAQIPAECLGASIVCDNGDKEAVFRIDTQSNMVVTNGHLDYENTSSYNCSVVQFASDKTEMCTVIYNITVLDVNDNAPIFSKEYYFFVIPSNGSEFIGQVHAEDKDEDGQQAVAFDIQESSEIDLFWLNSTNGMLKARDVKALSRDYYHLSIMASDSAKPPLMSQVTVLLSRFARKDNQLPLRTKFSKNEIESKKENFERNIGEILKVDITIEKQELKSNEDLQGNKIYISANKNGSALSFEELLRLVLRHYDPLMSYLSGESQSTSGNNDDSGMTAPVIALIAIACVVFIGAFVAIIVIRKQYQGHQRYKRLYQNLTSHSSLYESQELKVRMEDETSDYNGSVNTQDLEISDQNKTGALTSTLNPMYGLDSTASTSVAEAMLSLSELSDHLNKEDNVPTPDYENVPSVSVNKNVPKPDYENVPSTLEDRGQTVMGELSSTEVPIASSELDNVEMVRSESPTPDYDQHDASNSNEMVNTDLEPNDVISEQDSETAADSFNIDSEKNNENIQEEPLPDYNKKQVRFAHQVLDPDENKMTPLKHGNEKKDGGTKETSDATSEKRKDEHSSKHVVPPLDLSNEDNDEPKLNVSDESGWLEEEINSPIDVMTVDDKDNEFFEEEVTSL